MSDGGVSSDAGSDPGVPLLAQATAELTQIRPRMTIDPGDTKSTDLTTLTAWWPTTTQASFRTTPEGVDLTLHAVECRAGYVYPVRIYATSDCNEIEHDSPPWDGAHGQLRSKALCIGGPGARLYERRRPACLRVDRTKSADCALVPTSACWAFAETKSRALRRPRPEGPAPNYASVACDRGRS
jgi:hypothetical protein